MEDLWGDDQPAAGGTALRVRVSQLRKALGEGVCGQLMLALYRDGRQAEALAAYAVARTRLVEEIGIEPGRPLQALQQRILAQDPELGRNAPRAPPTPEARAILVLPGNDA